METSFKKRNSLQVTGDMLQVSLQCRAATCSGFKMSLQALQKVELSYTSYSVQVSLQLELQWRCGIATTAQSSTRFRFL